MEPQDERFGALGDPVVENGDLDLPRRARFRRERQRAASLPVIGARGSGAVLGCVGHGHLLRGGRAEGYGKAEHAVALAGAHVRDRQSRAIGIGAGRQDRSLRRLVRLVLVRLAPVRLAPVRSRVRSRPVRLTRHAASRIPPAAARARSGTASSISSIRGTCSRRSLTARRAPGSAGSNGFQTCSPKSYEGCDSNPVAVLYIE